jgi:leader peptidase (prepilin peptidase) / N-methyltransferase
VGVVLTAAFCGFVLGALLPLPIYRLSVGIGEPSRVSCDHCGQSLPGIALSSRCPDCGGGLGPPWWITATVAGAASAVLALALDGQTALPLFVALAVLGTGLGVIDIACHRLPTIVVAPAIAASAIFFLVLAIATGDWASFGRALLGAVALGVLFELLYLVPGGNLGYGDVRLAFLLGLFLGWLGWREVIWGALLPWLINAPVVLTLLLLQRVGRRSRLPFGPAMLAGALAAVTVVSWLGL